MERSNKTEKISNLISKITGKEMKVIPMEEINELEVNVDYWKNVFSKVDLDFDDTQKWYIFKNNLNKCASKRKNRNWDFENNDFEMIKNLFHYFNDKAAHEFAKDNKLPKPKIHTTLDINKDIFLTGAYGIGKSSILRSLFDTPFKKMRTEDFQFGRMRRISCIKVLDDCQNNMENLMKYTNDDWLFDDLGREDSLKFAKKSDHPLFTRIIESRYNYDEILRTYYTSNLSMSKIINNYSSRIESILNETCNIIEMTGEDYRKK